MSDEDRDIDIESDDENDSDNGLVPTQRFSNTASFSQAEKRAHHNALERKRRDHIKLSFTNLREAVPTLKGEKASRAQILKKTTECIQAMRRRINDTNKSIEELKRENSFLDAQLRIIGNEQAVDTNDVPAIINNGIENDSDESEQNDFNRRNKKMKTFHS